MVDADIRVDFEIAGENKLQALGARFLEARTILEHDLDVVLVAAVSSLEADVRTTMTRLPKSGGLETLIASSQFDIQITSSSAKLVMTSPYFLMGLDRGYVRHPVFGRKPRVFEVANPGFWTEPLTQEENRARVEAIAAVDAFGHYIESGL